MARWPERMGGLRLCAVTGAVLGALALPGGAGASTVQSPTSGIAFSAAPGEENYVIVSPSGGGMVRLAELIIDLRAGFGCVQVDRRTVDCAPRGRAASFELGDGGDTLEVQSGGIPVTARGGEGNDSLLAFGAGASNLDGGGGNDHVFGGLAADSLSGGLGSDDLRGDVVAEGGELRTSAANGGDDLLTGGPDTDGYEGGPGFDTVSYADAILPVTAVLPRPPEEGGTTPGQGGQDEGLPPDVEGVIGGAGADSLTGNRANNRLEGGPGNDTLRGNDGSDLLVGGADGDSIFARDGQLDSISCGPNRTSRPPRSDTLDTDLADGTPPADCETVTQGAIREGPNVRMSGGRLRVRRSGRVAVRLRCPSEVAIGCSGRLALRLLPAGRSPKSETSARSGAYELAAGGSARVRLRLSRRERAALRRRSRPARLTSVEAGEFGDKTTIRTVRLRRAR
jgi:hypothetical protein